MVHTQTKRKESATVQLDDGIRTETPCFLSLFFVRVLYESSVPLFRWVGSFPNVRQLPSTLKCKVARLFKLIASMQIITTITQSVVRSFASTFVFFYL